MAHKGGRRSGHFNIAPADVCDHFASRRRQDHLDRVNCCCLAGRSGWRAKSTRVASGGERARIGWRIERERSISVSSAVMSFKHEGRPFNLLDTPGRQDFSPLAFQ
jgi:hypothetical protein